MKITYSLLGLLVIPLVLSGCSGTEYTREDVLSDAGKKHYESLLAERELADQKIAKFDEIADAVAAACKGGEKACQLGATAGNSTTTVEGAGNNFTNVARLGTVANRQGPKPQMMGQAAQAHPVPTTAVLAQRQKPKQEVISPRKAKTWDDMTVRQRWEHYKKGHNLPEWDTLKDKERYQYYTMLVATHKGIPPEIFWAQLDQETAHTWSPTICSPVGACGLGQFMPATAKAMGLHDRYDPWESIHKAADYMLLNKKRAGSWKLALASYNAGFGAVTKYKGIPPYKETQLYVKKIMSKAKELGHGKDEGA